MYVAVVINAALCPTLLLLTFVVYSEAGLCDPQEILSEVATPTKQVLRSPNFPNGYFNNEYCRWKIDVAYPDYEVVRFQIQNTYIRYTATCGEDYLEVRDGNTAWSRQIKKWCGKLDAVQEQTTSNPGAFVTFKSNNMYTDKGFELEYWSVPKSVMMDRAMEWRVINYVLLAIFAIIILALIFAMIFVFLARKRITKRLAMEKEIEEKRRLNFNLTEKKSLAAPNNGLPPYNKVAPTDGVFEVGYNIDTGVRDPTQDGVRARKVDSTNNGSTTKVIRLEPALGSGMLKDTTTSTEVTPI